MTALPRWRRWAVTLARHAAQVLPAQVLSGQVLPGARSPWADAIRHELDYIEDDGAALRWALGCVVASYKARLARPGFTIAPRDILRHAAACGALMLVIGFALLGQAESQTEPQPPRQPVDETACETPDAGHPAPTPPPAHETACTGRKTPVQLPPEYPARWRPNPKSRQESDLRQELSR